MADPVQSFETLPRRIFLDTNVLDCAVKWGGQIFEHAPVPNGLPSSLMDDIHALSRIFMVCQRAGFELVVSPKTVAELEATPDPALRETLVEYGTAFLGGWPDSTFTDEDLRHARDLARRLEGSSFLSPLRDAADRELVAHAVAFGCDAFCSRDVRSIHRKRGRLGAVPLRFLTPIEWWDHLRPWARLWS